ncbi:phosphotransacetylase family protein, partial [Candidatus Poribacteria bacterium]|nr:phosphotransacetylase family protein [Candidatus Poribacteria bacterium]
MKTLFITSVCDYCGKTLVSLGLSKRLQTDGLKVGYMKSLGRYPTTIGSKLMDSDAALMYDVLKLEDPPELVSPALMTQDNLAQAYEGVDLKIAEKIAQAHKEISKDKDIVIVGGAGKYSEGKLLGASAKELVPLLDAKAIIVTNCEREVFVDDVLMVKDILGDNVAGVVINQVEFPKLDYIERRVVPFLTKIGVNILGILFTDSILMSVTIRELAETLGAEVLCCEDRLDDLVEKFSVGAMNIEGAVKYFRKVRSKAVITGGDRPDIQLAALQTDTKCLILTGNLYPNEIIIARAEEQRVPVLLVQKDTITIVQQVEDIMSSLRIRDRRKIDRAIQIIDEKMDIPLLYK